MVLKISQKVNSFKDLEVWQLSHQLVLDVYKLIEEFPKQEEYRLTSQLVRAVISIPTNIAEGKGRSTVKEYLHFLIIARGSLEETKYLILLSKDLNYVNTDKYTKLDDQMNLIGKKLNTLINALRK